MDRPTCEVELGQDGHDVLNGDVVCGNELPQEVLLYRVPVQARICHTHTQTHTQSVAIFIKQSSSAIAQHPGQDS